MNLFSAFLSFSSGEVLEPAPLFNDRLGKLLEDPIHVGALARPHPLQEADVATVTGDEEGQVGIPLHSFHRNCCRGQGRGRIIQASYFSILKKQSSAQKKNKFKKRTGPKN